VNGHNATPTTPAPLSGSTAPAAPIYASGNIDNLGTKEGMDLDTGQRHADQYAPGVDISFSSKSTHLDAHNERVSYTILPEPITEERRMCQQATGWVRAYADVYTLTEGRNICIKTDENRYSMLTITKRATAATGTIDFRYTTWN
jgi:hypothetical protein